MKWVMLKKYCQETGDTEDAVRWRRKAGIWADGKHSKVGPNGRIWVNVEEVQKWVEAYRPA